MPRTWYRDAHHCPQPLPFGPLFSSAALANHNPACTSNVFVYAVGYANSTVTRLSTCPLAAAKIIQVPAHPIQIRLTPDASTAVVTTYNNAVAFIDTAWDESSKFSPWLAVKTSTGSKYVPVRISYWAGSLGARIIAG